MASKDYDKSDINRLMTALRHDTILEETPVENVVEMFDTIHEYGIYQK